MARRDVNPWEWSTRIGFSQAVDVTDPTRILFCSGQAAIGPEGPPVADRPMSEQVALALENLAAVLAAGGMTTDNVVKLTLYTTHVDEFLSVYGHQARDIFGSNQPASTLIGVTRLAFPEMKVEIEAIAVQ